jgi:hypothetical protein
MIGKLKKLASKYFSSLFSKKFQSPSPEKEVKMKKSKGG